MRECQCRFELDDRRRRAIARARAAVQLIERLELSVRESPEQDWQSVTERLLTVARTAREALR
jgi:hypothetical protein